MARRNPEARMRLVEHFREFRRRLLYIAIGIVVGMIGGWFLVDFVFDALYAPVLLIDARGGNASLNFAEVTGALDMRVRVSLFLSIIITAPWWIYQVWAFVAPGLRRKEKRYVLVFLGIGAPLFLAGAYAGWSLLPRAVAILTALTPDGGSNIMDTRVYITFAIRLTLAFAVAFLFPVVMVALNVMGVVKAKTLLKGWRWAVVLCFTFAAIANPLPDPWSMIGIGSMMSVFFFSAVGIAALVDRRRDKRALAIAGTTS